MGSPQPEGRAEKAALRLILAFAVVYRLILLPSLPIQEIDYYRYLWDGQVVRHGFNPYHYSPAQVEYAAAQDAELPAELTRLGELARESPALQTIFERVHHRLVPTAYPPAAQAIFAAAALVTPRNAPLWAHILVLKTILVGFDLATLGVLVLLLRRLRLPTEWCLAYAWCPLVLKEIANSAHVDALAVFFTVLAIYLLACETQRPGGRACWAMAVLALAVLAKSYPIVLLPLATAYLWTTLGRRALVPLVIFVTVLLAAYLPFSGRALESPHDEEHGLVSLQPANPATGLSTFLTRWEINDFLFMLVNENLRWPIVLPDPWFVIVPSHWREALHRDLLESFVDRLPPGTDPGFLLTKLLLGIVLVLICLRGAWTVYRRPVPEVLLRGAFLALAWGWLLSSTQNPWYLLWSLPFMVFAGRRSWFLLTGLVLLYYVRFWLEHRAVAVGTDPSEAQAFFDHWLVWLEYGPFFLALLVEGRHHAPRDGASSRGA